MTWRLDGLWTNESEKSPGLRFSMMKNLLDQDSITFDSVLNHEGVMWDRDGVLSDGFRVLCRVLGEHGGLGSLFRGWLGECLAQSLLDFGQHGGDAGDQALWEVDLWWHWGAAPFPYHPTVTCFYKSHSYTYFHLLDVLCTEFNTFTIIKSWR